MASPPAGNTFQPRQGAPEASWEGRTIQAQAGYGRERKGIPSRHAVGKGEGNDETGNQNDEEMTNVE
jgi:hypothetical protein